MDLVADRCWLGALHFLVMHASSANISWFPQILFYYDYCNFLFLLAFDFTVTSEMCLDNSRAVACFAWPGVVMIFPSERERSPAYEERNRRSLADKAWLWIGCLWTSYWKRQRVRTKPVKFPLVHGPLSPQRKDCEVIRNFWGRSVNLTWSPVSINQSSHLLRVVWCFLRTLNLVGNSRY